MATSLLSGSSFEIKSTNKDSSVNIKDVANDSSYKRRLNA